MARRVFYPPPSDPQWGARALCADLDPAVMAPHDEDRVGVDLARRICGNCPARQDCLMAAMGEEGGDETHLRDGVRGGLTPAERYTAHRRRFKPRKPAGQKPCGTRAAYDRHRAAGEDPCDACRAEVRRLSAEKNAARKAVAA